MNFDELARLQVDKKAWTRKEAANQRKDDRRISMCGTKTKHTTEGRAKAEASQHKHYLSVYECEFCRHWHIGKPSS